MHNAKIAALFDLYTKATDKENAERENYRNILDNSMFGWMNSNLQSYDYLDNKKYQRILKLLKIMKETFGYDDYVTDGFRATMN